MLVIPCFLKVFIKARREVRRVNRRLLLFLRAELRTAIPRKKYEVLDMRGKLLEKELERVAPPPASATRLKRRKRLKSLVRM